MSSVCKLTMLKSLFEIQNDYSKKKIKVPDWQRGDAWTSEKKNYFEKTIREYAKDGYNTLPTAIVLFHLVDDSDTLYISDGLQRTMNSRNIYEKLCNELGQEQAERILSKVSINVHYMVYENNYEAKKDFIRQNQSTPLSAQEQAKTILTDLNDFPQWEKRILIPLHQHVRDAMSNIKKSESKKKKESNERDDYALFIRYLNKDKNPNSYCFNVNNIEDPKKRSNILEQKLVSSVSVRGIETTSKDLANFKSFIMDESAFIVNIWNNLDKTGWDVLNQTIKDTCMRFLFHLAILRRNNEIPIKIYEEFIKKFLSHCQGKQIVTYDNKDTVSFSKGDLSRLNSIQKGLGVYLLDNPNSKRKPRDISQIMPGFHASHVKSFSQNGEGNVVPLPAIQNMSNGTRDVVI